MKCCANKAVYPLEAPKFCAPHWIAHNHTGLMYWEKKEKQL